MFLYFRVYLQINDLTLIGLVFMKFGSLDSYNVLNTQVLFAYLFAIFEILSDPSQFWFLVVLKCYS